MKPESSDMEKFERIVFKKKNPLGLLLSFSLKLMQASQAGLLFGTNKTYSKFLPPDQWDRGVMHKFDGKGFKGVVLKYFGTWIVKYKGLSPVRLYKETQFGETKETDGIISFVLRKHQDFYEKGIKILIIDTSPEALRVEALNDAKENFSKVSILSYDGDVFKSLSDLKMNTSIVNQFKSQNFICAYIPDYGAIVFNMIDENLLQKNKDGFINKLQLKKRLNMLISAIEMASIAYIGLARGRQAAHIIWRKEKTLRKTALRLKNKEIELNEQKNYLKAVGAVNENQLNMEAVSITDGVYAFIDMIGSATLRNKIINPLDYFFILNLCHQIAADNANRYSCRVDNFIGDSVFLQNASPFDDEKAGFPMGTHERIMLIIFAITSIFNEIHLLKTGRHEMDKSGRVKKILDEAQTNISFRAGMEMGTALIGPLGSQKRRIVTAIGKAVNTASRLESTGVQDGIHISENVMNLLKDAHITRDTKIVWQTVFIGNDLKKSETLNDLDFFNCYKTTFGIKGNVIKEQKNISYKEFSKNISYVIKCIPDSDNF
ncbi:adenylate/guanylate cyclase domain-containing protein [Desulfobacula phenolica]|uniref:Adenylate and Guanylate cyclase catalytic domain-containing protein n=1 Tax=Desulfobacula phenolica TaxID=90732 RepID=A0A1H2EMV7_9BACT|nr:adenylate/guanylate cyclase domain-containing protein [Desulfobacula phenolica]SDT96445.1 Adenylate and Guanylate cyclase catalytic domain-containing protein [Desulfobacula phenolica]